MPSSCVLLEFSEQSGPSCAGSNKEAQRFNRWGHEAVLLAFLLLFYSSLALFFFFFKEALPYSLLY